MSTYNNGKIRFDNLIDSLTGLPIEIDLPEGCGADFIEGLNAITDDIIDFKEDFIKIIEEENPGPFVFSPRLIK